MSSPAQAPFHPQSAARPCGDGESRAQQARVSAEFREMPGLLLTSAQAARLFGLDTARCEDVLRSLVAHGVLATDGRTFARADAGARCA